LGWRHGVWLLGGGRRAHQKKPNDLKKKSCTPNRIKKTTSPEGNDRVNLAGFWGGTGVCGLKKNTRVTSW